MTTLDRPLPSPPVNRNTLIAASVVLFHVAALWALQAGLLRRAVDSRASKAKAGGNVPSTRLAKVERKMAFAAADSILPKATSAA